jgi:hypothetical protein
MWVHSKLRVLFISGEDGGVEVTRRLAALCQAYGISAADLGDRLMIVGAGEIGDLTLNRSVQGQGVANDAGLARLDQVIEAHRADVVILDPLVSFMPGGINDNTAVSAVMRQLVEMSVARRFGLFIAHHVAKAASRAGAEGEASAGLGAVSLASHARIVVSLEALDAAKEAPRLGILPERSKFFFKVTNGKANLAPRSDAHIFELTSVELPNADPANGYPKGDTVQVVKPYQAGGTLFTDPVLKQVLAVLARGTPSGAPYSPAPYAADRGYQADIAATLAPHFPGTDPTKLGSLANTAIQHVLDAGWVENQQKVKLPRKPDQTKGGARQGNGLVVRWDRTPWAPESDPAPAADHG